MDTEGGGSSIELWLAEQEEPGLNSELRERVQEQLNWEPGLDASSIAVEARNRAITLTGFVHSYPQKVAAERAAARVPRVRELNNDLRVVLPPAYERADPILAEEANRVLAWDALVPAGCVRVTVRAGCITLEGEVDWDHQRLAAQQAVQHLIGVTGVESRITVRPKWTTGEMQSSVVAALRHHPELHSRHVRVNMSGGVVVLRGRVPSIAERSAIERAVWNVPGVTGVVDELSIER